MLAGPSSGAAAVAPTFRELVAADFADQTKNLVLAGPSSGAAAVAPTFRELVAADFAAQAKNLVLAGPASGAASVAPTFRDLVAADIPSLSATYLPLAGGTMTGNITLANAAEALTSGNYALSVLGGVTDSGTAVGVVIGATANIGATNGGKLVSFRTNTSTEAAFIDKFNGNGWSLQFPTGTGTSYVLHPAGLTIGLTGLGANLIITSAGTASNANVYSNTPYGASSGTTGGPWGYLYTRHIAGVVAAAPTVAAGTGAGTGPTIAVSTNSNDIAGQVTLTTGTSPTASATIWTLTFNTAYATAAWCTIIPSNSTTASLVAGRWYYAQANTTTTTFRIDSDGTGLAATTAYAWTYECFQ